MAATLDSAVAASPAGAAELVAFLGTQAENCRNLATLLEGHDERLGVSGDGLAAGLRDMALKLESKVGTAWAVDRAKDCRVVAKAMDELASAGKRRRKGP
jgi:hypothetical protein